MKALFRTSKGPLADLQLQAATEVANVKQGLMRSAQEASMVRIKILKRVSMGWCSALAGEEREVPEELVKILEAELPGRTERIMPEKPKAEPEAKAEAKDRDVPGAPPVPDGKDRKLKPGKAVRKRRRREA